MRDDYAAEADDEDVIKPDNVLYITIALIKIKTSQYLSKTSEVWSKARGWKKKHTQSLRFFRYRNNNGNMVVGEISEFFQFPKRDISTARCKCTSIYWANSFIFQRTM